MRLFLIIKSRLKEPEKRNTIKFTHRHHYITAVLYAII